MYFFIHKFGLYFAIISKQIKKYDGVKNHCQSSAKKNEIKPEIYDANMWFKKCIHFLFSPFSRLFGANTNAFPRK